MSGRSYDSVQGWERGRVGTGPLSAGQALAAVAALALAAHRLERRRRGAAG
jgi:hypothetical protein